MQLYATPWKDDLSCSKGNYDKLNFRPPLLCVVLRERGLACGDSPLTHLPAAPPAQLPSAQAVIKETSFT